MAARLSAMGVKKYTGLTRKSGSRYVWTGKVSLDERVLETPLRWTKPRMIFVNSMSDLFQDAVPDEFITRVWEVMARSERHVFQILTKRPQRMSDMTRSLPLLPNVWLGTSVEDESVLQRLQYLRETRARVRFVSFEPLIGSVASADLGDIDWAIVGGESGPRARTMDPEWVDEIFELCARSKTSFFFKQWGGVNKKVAGRTYRGALHDNFPSHTYAERERLPA
jgi:protein gp37